MIRDTEDVVARVKRLLPVSWDNEVDASTGEPIYANMTFGEHQTQAMSMAPDDWMALNAVPDLIQSLSDRIDVLEANVVELWHESEAGRKALHEYLGMSWEEYIIWASPRAALHQEGIAP